MKKFIFGLVIIFSVFIFIGCTNNKNEISEFDKLVNELPEVVTLDDENKVIALREMYNNLTKEEKVKVKLHNVLESYELKIIDLKLDIIAKEIDDLILALPSDISLSDNELIINVRKLYNEIDDRAKAKVKKLEVLINHESKLSQLKDEDLNAKQSASFVDELIAALPDEISLNDESNILHARNKYDQLNELAKSKVKHLDKLVSSEDKLLLLKRVVTIDGDKYAHVGETSQLIVSITPSSSGDKVLYTSSNTNIATVDNNGLVKFLTKGVVKITAKVNELIYGTIEITVFENIQTEALRYLEDRYNNLVVDNDIELIKEYKGYQIDWYMSDDEYFDDNGKFKAPILDFNTDSLCVINVEGVEYETQVSFTLKGFGKVIDVIEEYALTFIPSTITNHILLPTTHPSYGGKIIWESTNEEVFTSKGVFTRFDENVAFAVRYRIEYAGEIVEGVINTVAIGKTDLQKANEVIEQLDLLYRDLNEVNSDLDLVTSYEKFNPEISWRSDNESVISSNGKFSTPLYTQKVTIFLTVAINESSTTKVYTVNVKGVEYEDKWEAVDVFLKNIYKETIENQRFILYGSEPGYEYVPALNKGYIPFYNNNNSEIKVDLVDQLSADGRYFVNNSGTAIYPNIKKTSTNYIVIHNTGMAAPSATAAGLNRAIHNTTREASWHYSVDDKEIYQHVPNDYVAWHAGDGSTKYGSTWVAKDGKTYIGGGNYNGIGIEMCVYQGIDFNMAMRNTAKLTAELLLQYELNFDGIKQHYDFAGKDCPQVIRQANRMEEFLNLVRIEYFAKTHLKDVKFTFTSLSPDIMDNKGNVINHPGIETMVKYKVTAEYNGKTNEYVFSSKLATLK